MTGGSGGGGWARCRKMAGVPRPPHQPPHWKMRREMGKKEEGRMVEKDGIDMWES